MMPPKRATNDDPFRALFTKLSTSAILGFILWLFWTYASGAVPFVFAYFVISPIYNLFRELEQLRDRNGLK